MTLDDLLRRLNEFKSKGVPGTAVVVVAHERMRPNDDFPWKVAEEVAEVERLIREPGDPMFCECSGGYGGFTYEAVSIW